MLVTNKQTGYPSIDKPWMKYYDDSQLDYSFPHMNIYEYMKSVTENYKDMTAITYYGNHISYSDLYRNIDLAAKFLVSLGVNVQSRIIFLMPNIPETAYLFYAAAKIGATSDFIDPRPDSVDFKVSAEKTFSLIESEKIDYIIALDQCYLAMIKPVEHKIKQYGIDKVVIVSASTSMGKKGKKEYIKEKLYFGGIAEVWATIKKQKKVKKAFIKAISDSELQIIDYASVSKECNEIIDPGTRYDEGWLVAIVHSSGTSGTKPKPIPLTHDNMNAYIHNTIPARMPTKEGDKALHMLPYFAAYGLVNVAHSGFCHANNMIQIPEFKPSDIGKLIVRHRPQTIIGTPAWLVQLMYDKALIKADLSCLSMVTYGGDSMDAVDEKGVNLFLENHGCKYKITKGHGMSECCGCATFANHEYNELNSVGIPLPYTTYAIIDPETKEMIRFEDESEYIEGELVISSKTLTPGILDDSVIVTHKKYNGEDYILTKDIARMNRDGIITFLARSDRSFTRYDGYKYKPYEVENLFKTKEEILHCIICPYNDEKKHGLMPVANIVVDADRYITREEKIELVYDIINKLFLSNPDVSTRQIPSMIRFVEKLPLTNNGKVDFKAIEQFAKTGIEICIDFEEDSLSVGNFRIR